MFPSLLGVIPAKLERHSMLLGVLELSGNWPSWSAEFIVNNHGS